MIKEYVKVGLGVIAILLLSCQDICSMDNKVERISRSSSSMRSYRVTLDELRRMTIERTIKTSQQLGVPIHIPLELILPNWDHKKLTFRDLAYVTKVRSACCIMSKEAMERRARFIVEHELMKKIVLGEQNGTIVNRWMNPGTLPDIPEIDNEKEEGDPDPDTLPDIPEIDNEMEEQEESEPVSKDKKNIQQSTIDSMDSSFYGNSSTSVPSKKKIFHEKSPKKKKAHIRLQERSGAADSILNLRALNAEKLAKDFKRIQKNHSDSEIEKAFKDPNLFAPLSLLDD